MTQSEHGSKSQNSGGAPETYTVGYGRPPKEYCFKPGQSGNPPGKRKQREITNEWGKAGKLIIQEAYRLVELPEGGKTIKLPAIQAAVRSNLMSAIRGDKKAFITFISLVSEIERTKEELQLQTFVTALDYKLSMKELIAQRERESITAPDPIPHPDDVIVNPRTGEVTIRGPLDETEKADLEFARSRRVELKQTLKHLEELLVSTPSPERARAIRAVIKRAKAQSKLLTQILAENDSLRARGD